MPIPFNAASTRPRPLLQFKLPLGWSGAVQH
jgi:hypothetical protein